jgi:hypothetical protein
MSIHFANKLLSSPGIPNQGIACATCNEIFEVSPTKGSFSLKVSNTAGNDF